jgi:hypothetical protein
MSIRFNGIILHAHLLLAQPDKDLFLLPCMIDRLLMTIASKTPPMRRYAGT